MAGGDAMSNLIKVAPGPRIKPVVTWLCTRCWEEGPGYETPEPHASGQCEPRVYWSSRTDPDGTEHVGCAGNLPSDPYETARALAAAALPSIAELERRQRVEDRREAWILVVLLALSASTILVGALSWAGVLR